MKYLKIIFFEILVSFLCTGCGIYSFSGISISPEVKTFEVRQFGNQAPIVEPGLDRRFTTDLQDFILNQTNLDLVTNNGDIIYEGEIVQFYIAPNTATADQTAAESRLTIAIRLRYIDTKNSDNDLEQTFSFFFDYPSSQLLTGDTAETAFAIIFERITQDMVNATLAKW
ncbi:LPS assembly lipoprotein LptE [Aquimarina agarivorans]|uniref:LPS assembly lipoprotein LptE n=1 Tax=Aquimarina agarivorans TaxID=980584 RepID=UPI000248FC9F|nr:LptE family protein [Aquimarina agarivorans]